MSKLLFFLSAALWAHAQPATPLFDGKTLNGWRVLGGGSKFEVSDGTIVGTSLPNSEHTFLCTERNYGDFILEYDFLVDAAMNSGVQIRSHAAPKVFGLQVEIDGDLKTKRFWSGGIFDQTRRGWLFDLSRNEAARQAFRPGEWNRMRVEAKGDSIKTWIDGVAAADLVDAVDLDGFIGLQVHQNRNPEPMRVRFRNLRIQDLGVRKWAPLTGKLSPEFTIRTPAARIAFDSGMRFDEDLYDGDRLLAKADPQKGVKPIAGLGVSVSFHGGRLVIHRDGVRVVDTRRDRPAGQPVGTVEVMR